MIGELLSLRSRPKFGSDESREPYDAHGMDEIALRRAAVLTPRLARVRTFDIEGQPVRCIRDGRRETQLAVPVCRFSGARRKAS